MFEDESAGPPPERPLKRQWRAPVLRRLPTEQSAVGSDIAPTDDYT